MALPLPVISPPPDPYHMAPHRIKRCTFRRLIDVEVASERVYDVECLFPDRKFPIPLGDLDRPRRSATPASRRTSSDPTKTEVEAPTNRVLKQAHRTPIADMARSVQGGREPVSERTRPEVRGDAPLAIGPTVPA